ncbi:hypothetical protein [Streptomyces sp. ISL-94]|uniref:hypothetical protein n=1 Tax=Streptomyces sp. ISL-94 TaxID=2819190 RepID=UPI001BE4E4BA|nr:hypothetical protein [Streptomyces sp. ISL-94]MBT2482389.1 hypothetical protein [Streptomyces sp. ISL-94]
MIVASVDTTSQSFALGQVTGVLLVALVGIVLLWRLTGSWRSPSTPAGGDPALTLREERKRRLLIVGVTVLIAVGAGVKAAASYNPEPRASETRAAAPAFGAAEAGTARTVVLPDSFEDFRLLTGEAAERVETEVLAGRKLPEGTKTGYYDEDGDENIDLVVLVRSAEWDPKVREEKATKSISQEFRNFFTAAKARDATRFAPGPYGGGISCGFADYFGGTQTVCAWSDATTFGAVRLVRETNLADAAQTTLTLRNAAMR